MEYTHFVSVAIEGFAGVCKNVEKDVVNMDFFCVYVGGELKTSEESTDVGWVAKEKAQEMVTYPLTKKRLANVLSEEKKVRCFNFRKEPFKIIEEDSF